jgi:uncharacterized zinc-type alcohol dehydrogenase-like protein
MAQEKICFGYGIPVKGADIKPMRFTRRELNSDDLEIKLTYCGVCHSDVHHAYNEWHDSMYPMVPGHEMTGIVTAMGDSVQDFRIGEKVAVGNLVDSCLICKSCIQGDEQYCENGGPSWVYNGHSRDSCSGDMHKRIKPSGVLNMGGYSNFIVVRSRFVLHFPDNLDMAKGTPLLCAGITVYNPLKQSKVKPGMKVAIAGIGGLGHLAIKFAKAMGAEVTAITSSFQEKAVDILKLGAINVINSNDYHQMKEFKSKFDLILDTIPHPHTLNPYLDLLANYGKIWVLGTVQPFTHHNLEPTQKPYVAPFDDAFDGSKIIFANLSICGSTVGGIALTQEMLNFSAQYNITADIEIIPIQSIRQAFDNVKNNIVKYRYVIDLSSIKA